VIAAVAAGDPVISSDFLGSDPAAWERAMQITRQRHSFACATAQR
jgi:hypothetical protein